MTPTEVALTLLSLFLRFASSSKAFLRLSTCSWSSPVSLYKTGISFIHPTYITILPTLPLESSPPNFSSGQFLRSPWASENGLTFFNLEICHEKISASMVKRIINGNNKKRWTIKYSVCLLFFAYSIFKCQLSIKELYPLLNILSLIYVSKCLVHK